MVQLSFRQKSIPLKDLFYAPMINETLNDSLFLNLMKIYRKNEVIVENRKLIG